MMNQLLRNVTKICIFVPFQFFFMWQRICTYCLHMSSNR
uniref:Uncharacterized protein n=1 Tax=Rhizophora mucronata TaxID=61149 RepID=A0A2P2ND83_RHIMU